MKFLIQMFVLLMAGSLWVSAQNDRKVIRQGIKAYEKGDYSDAEVQFRKAGDLNGESFIADYNTGAALYKQEKYEETAKQFESLAQSGTDPEKLAKVWHNMGNSLLEGEQYQASIEAYKNSLRLNPGDMDTKYNLAYAREKLEEQQQQNQQQQQQNNDQQNQDQQQNQQNQDQQQNQQNQDQQQKQQNQDQQAQQQDEQQGDQQQARPQEISREDAERMLSAIQQKEKDVKEKVDKEKAAVAKVKTEKDW